METALVVQWPHVRGAWVACAHAELQAADRRTPCVADPCAGDGRRFDCHREMVASAGIEPGPRLPWGADRCMCNLVSGRRPEGVDERHVLRERTVRRTTRRVSGTQRLESRLGPRAA